MVIMIDLDGTLCTEELPENRAHAKPLPGAAEAVDKYIAEGHVVVIWTGRGWPEYQMTRTWLKDNGFHYNELLMGKPIANLIIDDRSRDFEGWDKDYLETIRPEHRR
jgi:hypothetical protein